MQRFGRMMGFGYSTPRSVREPADVGESWDPGLRSTDGDVIPARQYIEARIKHLIQTDGFLAGAVDTHCNHVVGSGLMLSSIPDWERLGISEDQATEMGDMQEREFWYYINSSRNWADAGRRFNWAGISVQAYKSFLINGEILGIPKFSRNQLWNTSVMIIDPNRLRDPDTVVDYTKLRAGILLDENSAPVKYYVHKDNPLDLLQMRMASNKAYTEIEPFGRTGRKRILHYFDPVGTEQTRGISLFAPVVDAVKRQHDLSDATIKAAIYQTLIAAVIKSNLPYESAMAVMGGKGNGKNGDSYLEGVKQYQQNHLEYYDQMRIKMDGMKTIHLLPEEDLELRAAGALNADYAEFAKSMNREAARGVQLTNEGYTGDYAALSYSGGQLSAGEAERGHIGRRNRVMVPFCQDIYELWAEEYYIKYPEKLPPNIDFYTHRDAICRANWIGPPPILGDQLKIAQAAQYRIENNISTREYEMAQIGLDWRSGLRQIAREQKFSDDLKLRNPKLEEQVLVQENKAKLTAGKAGAG
jgi:lambda family phage portal protein